jgi:hypothetical protein
MQKMHGAIFCLPPASMQSKRKYPKKRRPVAAQILRFSLSPGVARRAVLGPLATRGLLAAPLRVLRMQIGFPADLSRRKLRCSARQTGASPYHSKFILLNKVGLTVGLVLTNREILQLTTPLNPIPLFILPLLEKRFLA